MRYPGLLMKRNSKRKSIKKLEVFYGFYLFFSCFWCEFCCLLFVSLVKLPCQEHNNTQEHKPLIFIPSQEPVELATEQQFGFQAKIFSFQPNFSGIYILLFDSNFKQFCYVHFPIKKFCPKIVGFSLFFSEFDNTSSDNP